MNEIKRKVELWLAAEMREAVPGSRSVASGGGDDISDADEVEPPFTFIKVVECDEIASPEQASGRGVAKPGVYQLTVKVCRVSHIDETTTAGHSAAVRLFKDALRGIGDRVEALHGGYYEAQTLVINGLNLKGTETISDREKQSHADIVTVTVGAMG
ncbi:MAG: hypothetical protein QOE70_4038 [Chthoniobacter sp.]|jgi:hypothetical protein|nr:hypothetical protein [Chthoniobacter sp.]